MCSNLKWSLTIEKLIDNPLNHVFVMVTASIEMNNNASLWVWLTINNEQTEFRVSDKYTGENRGVCFYKLYKNAIYKIAKYNRDEDLIPDDLFCKLNALFSEKDF